MVRTRFAPSPTGYLHIGGVRTALFNWLFAKKHGGQFILRIDDTDQQRNVGEALQPILDGFRWLGMDWDEGPEVGGDYGPYYQSERLEIYQAAAQKLIDNGAAYYDYSTPEEYKAEREEAEKAKKQFVYSRKWMAETPEDREKFASEGRSYVVRLKMPREGSCKFFDHVRDDVEVKWITEPDHVIQRADGTCLYHLANVVDDHEMKITHVIRAEEHLSNTPRQIFILEGLGYDRPEYAHLPFVAEPGGSKKLSKRKIKDYLKKKEFKDICDLGVGIAEKIGLEITPESFNPVLVDFYREVGYLPHAVLNALLMIGWAYDDVKEIFSSQEMLDLFSLEKVNKGAASLDVSKLTNRFQLHYVMEMPVDEKVKMCVPYLQKAKLVEDPISEDDLKTVEQIINAAGDRIKVLGQILDYDDFFVADESLTYDEKAFEKRIVKPENGTEILKKFRDQMQSMDTFDAKSIEALIGKFVEEQEIKLGLINNALRVAVTGKAVGFGTYETLAILGKEKCLNRIDLALLKAKG